MNEANQRAIRECAHLWAKKEHTTWHNGLDGWSKCNDWQKFYLKIFTRDQCHKILREEEVWEEWQTYPTNAELEDVYERAIRWVYKYSKGHNQYAYRFAAWIIKDNRWVDGSFAELHERWLKLGEIGTKLNKACEVLSKKTSAKTTSPKTTSPSYDIFDFQLHVEDV